MGCKAAIPLMAKGGGGSIVNFSSAAGNKPSPDLAAYNSAKAAVVTLALWQARGAFVVYLLGWLGVMLAAALPALIEACRTSCSSSLAAANTATCGSRP